MRAFKYKSIALGGTFDHIHKGHQALFKRAFDTGAKVYIGLTTDDFVKKSGKKIIHDFETRKKNLQIYLLNQYPKRDYEITKLDRNFGPGIFTNQIEAIVVSTETAPKVADANKKRKELNLPDLKIEEISLILAQDQNRISSTRIRSGKIDSEGNILRKNNE
jgi:pantetheine-phosphate adenylyltransferase